RVGGDEPGPRVRGGSIDGHAHVRGGGAEAEGWPGGGEVAHRPEGRPGVGLADRKGTTDTD
ncbi:MAG: hypothetical protein AAF264_13840, partial [Pseudomonadota bacterium]